MGPTPYDSPAGPITLFDTTAVEEEGRASARERRGKSHPVPECFSTPQLTTRASSLHNVKTTPATRVCDLTVGTDKSKRNETTRDQITLCLPLPSARSLSTSRNRRSRDSGIDSHGVFYRPSSYRTESKGDQFDIKTGENDDQIDLASILRGKQRRTHLEKSCTTCLRSKFDSTPIDDQRVYQEVVAAEADQPSKQRSASRRIRRQNRRREVRTAFAGISILCSRHVLTIDMRWLVSPY